MVAASFLTKSFEQNSILWLIIAAVVGGIIGGFCQFLFQDYLKPKLERSRSSKAAMHKYRYPLLRAAEMLDIRMENLINYADVSWFEDADDYYLLSTLYCFGCFFGWAKVIEDEAYTEFESSNRKAREFNKLFNRVFEGFTSFDYIKPLAGGDNILIEKATMFRFLLTAIGELLIEPYPKQEGAFPCLVPYVEFAEKYRTSDDVKKWFSHLLEVIKQFDRSPDDIIWNRLLVFATNLRVFTAYLDSACRQTNDREIHYLDEMNPMVKVIVKKEIDKSGYCGLIAEPKKQF